MDTPHSAAQILRHLACEGWLLADRDRDLWSSLEQNKSQIRATLSGLGWSLATGSNFARLVKHSGKGPTAELPSPAARQWVILLVASALPLPPTVRLSDLVQHAQAAAKEIGVELRGDVAERRALAEALRYLGSRGAVEITEAALVALQEVGESDGTLCLVHHERLGRVVTAVPPPGVNAGHWASGLGAERSVASRMLSALVDSPAVLYQDVSPEERDWLRSRRGVSEVDQLAEAFGLVVERRIEGVALVVPDDSYRYERELGPNPFPAAGGTVPHAALLLIDHAVKFGVYDTTGWVQLSASAGEEFLKDEAERRGTGRAGWAQELVKHPRVLVARVTALLQGRDLMRVQGSGDEVDWLFSPVASRWNELEGGLN